MKIINDMNNTMKKGENIIGKNKKNLITSWLRSGSKLENGDSGIITQDITQIRNTDAIR